MEVVREIKKDGRPVIVVLTGDGHAEFRRLKAFAERFDGEKILFFPLQPGPVKQTAFSALKGLKVYSKYKYTSFLFIIDKEHFKIDAENELKNQLDKLKINIKHINPINQNSYSISCKVGPHDLTVYVAILGKVKCSEEEVSKLIDLELHQKVEADMKELRRFYRERGIEEEELIRSANSKNLKQAFPSVSTILAKIKSEVK